MSTPSKRRRTSPTTYVSISDKENQSEGPGRPSTPKRASYQSPTKASLARSNPKVLQQVVQAKERRESEPNRRQSLRNAVLGNKNVAFVPMEEEGIGPIVFPVASTQVEQTPRPRTDNPVDNVTSAFKDIRPLQASANTNAIIEQPVQPSIPTSQQRYVSTFSSPSIVPKLVRSASTTNREHQPRRSASAELPPTPVELGKITAPTRPRGLASSSPGGSGRRRVRTRGGHSTSSPLKPRHAAPAMAKPNEVPDQIEIASGIEDEGTTTDTHRVVTAQDDQEPQSIEEVVQLDASETLDMDGESNDPVIRGKQDQLAAVQKQLRILQEELKGIQTFSHTLDADNYDNFEQTKFKDNITLLLKASPPITSPWLAQPEEDDLFKENSTKYLNLFASSNLRMSYETWHKVVRGSPKFVYQTTFWAPEYWPTNTLALTFETTIDLESETIGNIKFMNTQSISSSLQTWVEDRLQDPVMKYDLATITVGIGKYFEATVKRAKIFKHLTEKLKLHPRDTTLTKSAPADFDASIATNREALDLLPHLHSSTYTFTAQEDTNTAEPRQTRTRSSILSTRQVLLSYKIALNWIGQPSVESDVCLLGFSAEVTRHAKSLFRQVQSVDGVVTAFEAVCDGLGLRKDDAAQGSAAAAARGEKMKGRKSRARRMTVFE